MCFLFLFYAVGSGRLTLVTVEHLAFVATEVLFQYRLTGDFSGTGPSLYSVRSLLLVQMPLGLS